MSRVLIVTGMHRSGTSLTANLLHRAGIDMGDEMLPADLGNPHGYHEDALVQAFHRDVLMSAGVSDGFTVSEKDVPITIDQDARSRAKELVAARENKPQWGFKDPRTALFLDLWSELVPDACYLFVFRRPTAVVDSLLRRASNDSINADPARALVLWRIYNSEILRFFEEHRSRCMVWNADLMPERASALLDRLRDRFGFDLSAVPIDEVFVRGAYHRNTRMRSRLVAAGHPAESRKCDRLYRTLVSLADEQTA